jgi:acyl carrier protein
VHESPADVPLALIVLNGLFPPMNSGQLRTELKRLIVTELNLKGRDPDSIEDDAPLFGAGLGLDSLDALQLAMVIEEKLDVRIPEGEEARAIFKSVRAIADHIAKVRSA